MPAPVIYVTDFRISDGDPADWFDLAYLLRSNDHDVRGVCLTRPEPDTETVLTRLFSCFPNRPSLPPVLRGADALLTALAREPEPVNLVVVGGYGSVAAILTNDRSLFREKIARLFLIGGHVNDYSVGRTGERLPIDPRLKERHPERFEAAGDTRTRADNASFAALLTSGESVIWLPRDLCLWSFSAAGMLADGGPVTAFLLSELQRAARQSDAETDNTDESEDGSVLLSALPALLLAVRPDPFVWMRLFRAMALRVEMNAAGAISSVVTQTERPNLYAVIAIDSAALSRFLAAALRDRPLSAFPAAP